MEILKLPNSEIEVQYIPPGIQQKGNLMAFLLITARDFILTPEEAQNMRTEELYDQVFQGFGELMSDENEGKRTNILGIMLLDHRGKHLIYDIIRDCFPGVDPALLKEEIYIEMFSHLMNIFNTSVLQLQDIEKGTP